jgi:hypothetical protein
LFDRLLAFDVQVDLSEGAQHAYSRFLKVKGEIEGSLPTRGGKRRELKEEDFSRKGAIFLREKSQFDYLVERPDSKDRAKAIIDAMTLIEEDYESLDPHTSAGTSWSPSRLCRRRPPPYAAKWR